MKLYYAPGACSLAPHIALLEAGLPFDTEKVDLKSKTTGSGKSFSDINPKGYVPALTLDDETLLTESASMLQYIADKANGADLAPKAGTMDRYRLSEWLTFISSELHKGIGSMFNPAMPAEFKPAVIERMHARLGVLDKHLAGKDYIMGDKFSVADAYAFTIINWTNVMKIDISRHKNIAGFMARVAGWPKVQSAMKAEGLI